MLVELSEREIEQLVAALHNWQIDAMNEDLVEAFLAHHGETPMNDEEIDGLVERLDSARSAAG
jgi:beta-xylosidase